MEKKMEKIKMQYFFCKWKILQCATGNWGASKQVHWGLIVEYLERDAL